MKLQKLLKKVIFFVSTLFIVSCTHVPKENNITVEKLHEILKSDSITVLDVRTPEEIDLGKIKAEALEADYFAEDFVEKVVAQLPKDKNVYVYCRGGNRSAKAVNKLRELGYEKVFNIEGGINAWKAKEYPVE